MLQYTLLNESSHLLSNGADAAIAAREQPAPDRELPPHHGSARGAVPYGPDEPRPGRGLPRPLPEVPHATAHGAEGERAPYVLYYPVRTGIAVGYRRVPHRSSFSFRGVSVCS